MRTIIGSIIKANDLFKMINNHDRIAVGVSGGKDSSLLLCALNLFALKMKQSKNWDLKIYGICVNVGFGKIDYSNYLKWAHNNNLDIRIINSNVAEVLNLKKKNNKIVCSLCSKMKKAIIIKEAKKLKCNKIAFGHHIDDAIETLFLNMIYEGRITTFYPNTYLDREKIYLIRPLALANESDMIRVTNKLNIPIITNPCPNAFSTNRTYLKEFINKYFYDNDKFPNAYLNFRSALLNGKQSNLWFDNKENKKDLLKEVKQGHHRN